MAELGFKSRSPRVESKAPCTNTTTPPTPACFTIKICPDPMLEVLFFTGHDGLHFALSCFLFLPNFYSQKYSTYEWRQSPLKFSSGGKKWFSVPALDSLITVETQHSLGSQQLLSSVCFILSHTPSFASERNRYLIWQVYGFFFSWRSDCSFFFLGRATVSFKSFSPGFLRNLSVWHVCHFSQSSSESWQFSHNGICWQVVRADSDYVWKTVKLVKKKLKREPPYIWNSMLSCKYVLRMQRPPLLIKLHAQQWQPEKVESLKINVILSLQRSDGTLPLNSIYLHKIEFAFNAQ